MLALTLLAATLAVAAARPLKASGESYSAWAAEFSTAGTIFEGSEARFTEALGEIAAHNADKSQTWSAGVNKFTAMTKKEFKAFIGRGYSASGPSMEAARKAALPADLDSHVEVSALPASLDWREKTPSVVTKVKDQGGCGGCWSFSAAETLESNVAINTGTLLTLSEQQILACTPNPNQCGGTGGCSGATQELAFAYVQTKGIATEASWPYTMQTGKCDYTNKKFGEGPL
jgi:cathepsin L